MGGIVYEYWKNDNYVLRGDCWSLKSCGDMVILRNWYCIFMENFFLIKLFWM